MIRRMALAVAICALIMGAVWVARADNDDNKQEIQGLLTAIDLSTRAIQVSGQVFVVSPTAKIEVEKQGHIAFDGLAKHIGKIVEIKFDNQKLVYEIEVQLTHEITGALTAVDPTKWTLTVDQKSFSVSSSVIVEIEEKGSIPFSQLANYLGRRVELKLDAKQLVFKIEIKK